MKPNTIDNKSAINLDKNNGSIKKIGHSKKIIIGLSGIAGVGKDSFYKLFKKICEERHGKCVRRVALADALKNEVSMFCIKNYGIDPSNYTIEEKEKIRPFLIFHGNFKRNQTNGRYWFDIIENEITEDNHNDIFVITDIRYAELENDELFLLKSTKQRMHIDSMLIHISKRILEPKTKYYFLGKLIKKALDREQYVSMLQLPQNEFEAANNPKLIEASDYQLSYEYKKGSSYEEILNSLEPEVCKFVNKIF